MRIPMSFKRRLAIVPAFQKPQRGRIGSVREVLLEEPLEDRTGRRNRSEERRARAQLEVVREAEDVRRRFALEHKQRLDTFLKTGAEHRMSQVCHGFSSALDRVQLRSRTGAKTIELGEDKPHPVGPLVSASDFRKRLLVDIALRTNKAGQFARVICVGQGCIHFDRTASEGISDGRAENQDRTGRRRLQADGGLTCQRWVHRGDKVTGQIGPSEDATILIGGALTADKSTLKTRPQPGRTAAFDSCELTVGDEKLVGTIHGGDAYSPLIYGLSRGARSGARASVHRASSSSIATEAFSWTSVGLNSCV